MQQGTVSSADRLSQGVIDGRKYGEYLNNARALSGAGKRTAASGVAWSG